LSYFDISSTSTTLNGLRVGIDSIHYQGTPTVSQPRLPPRRMCRGSYRGRAAAFCSPGLLNTPCKFCGDLRKKSPYSSEPVTAFPCPSGESA
jgi:hypothetical protein